MWPTLFAATLAVASQMVCTNACVCADEETTSSLLQRAQELGNAGKSAEAIELLNGLLVADPEADFAYYLRGCEQLRSGKFAEAVSDFDAYIARDPTSAPRQWQRGIALYYAGRPADGAKQFELYQSHDASDVENVVWRFVCQARAEGVEKARADMLPVDRDARIPMMEIYALFQGKLQPAEVLDAARAGDASAESKRVYLFYAHLYVGLYHEATDDARQAKEHLLAAAEIPPAGHYMGDVAKVHAELIRRQEAAGTPAPNAKTP